MTINEFILRRTQQLRHDLEVLAGAYRELGLQYSTDIDNAVAELADIEKRFENDLRYSMEDSV